MADLRAEIEEQLQALEELRKGREAIVNHVRDLLKRADEKRLSTDKEQRKWSRALDHLEDGLDEAKAKLTQCEGDIKKLRKKLEDGAPSAKAHRRPADAPTADAAERPIAEDPITAAQHILSAPFEALGHIPLQEIALGRRYLIARAHGRPRTIEQRRLAGRIELANQCRRRLFSAASATPPQERRKQVLLRNAIDKICAGRFDEATEAEIGLVIGTHSLLAQRVDLDDTSKRLRDVLSEAVSRLDQEENGD